MGLTERAKYMRRPWNLEDTGGWVEGVMSCRRDRLKQGWVKGEWVREAASATVLSRSVLADSATPWIVACQTPLFMGFSRQEYWSGLPCHPPGDPPNPAVEPRSPALQADSLPSEPPGKPSQRFCH